MTQTPTDRSRSAHPTDAGAHPGLPGFAADALARLCAERRSDATPGSAQSVLGDPCAAAMAYALCDADDGAASILVDELIEAGVPVEDVCLDHLAPAARRLGDLWDTDRLPFTEVTMASARIQSILRRLPPGRGGRMTHGACGALFGAVPGEQHTLGVIMAADLFRRGGWDVGLMIGATHDEMIARISRDDRPVIGLSCSSDHAYPALRRLLAAIARARPGAEILLAGQIVKTPERVAELPMPVTAVADMAEAEAEMTRIAARPGAAATQRPGPAGSRATSVA